MQSEVKRTNVVCDDTDVYVHLLLFYGKLNLSCCCTMEGPSAEQTAIDISEMHVNMDTCCHNFLSLMPSHATTLWLSVSK